jgi:hypothetical protein
VVEKVRADIPRGNRHVHLEFNGTCYHIPEIHRWRDFERVIVGHGVASFAMASKHPLGFFS